MEIEGLDYNTQRQKLKLMAYGRDIQQMVDIAVALPTKAERQRCAENIIDIMRRVVPSQLSNKERTPALWYHLALMSDFQLDIDYPVEIMHEDKMAIRPDNIPYNKKRMPPKHYGRLIFDMLEKMKTMPESEERNALALQTATQMHRSLMSWGSGTADEEKVASDIARFTDGIVQIDPADLDFSVSHTTERSSSNRRRKKRKK